MKKVIGLVVFATIGLLAFAREAPTAQAADNGVCVAEAEIDAAGQPPSVLDCPANRPRCCEWIGNHCLICITRTQSCP